MTAADVANLFDLLGGGVIVLAFALGYIGGYLQ